MWNSDRGPCAPRLRATPGGRHEAVDEREVGPGRGDRVAPTSRSIPRSAASRAICSIAAGADRRTAGFQKSSDASGAIEAGAGDRVGLPG